jgi:hypothetical protein
LTEVFASIQTIPDHDYNEVRLQQRA